MKRARRLLCGLLFAPCPLAVGCLIPYAYPKLDYVPACDVGPKASDVHAFRLDVTAGQVDLNERGSFTLTAIEPRADGCLPAQAGLSLERGLYVAGVADSYNVGWLHATRVRLYRPGYQLVELPAWGSVRDVVWRPALDWADQEKAVDDLLRRPIIGAGAADFAKGRESFWNEQEAPHELPVATASPRTVEPLVFAAAEYERVARLAPTPEDAARLREKASRLVEVRPAAQPTR